MKKRGIALFLAVLMAAAPLSAEAGTEAKKEEGALTRLTLNEVAHSIFYAPQYVAIEKGYFEEQGIDLDLVCGFGADKVMTAVLTGEADIGFMGSEASIYTYIQGASGGFRLSGKFCTAYPAGRQFSYRTRKAGRFPVDRSKGSGSTGRTERRYAADGI